MARYDIDKAGVRKRLKPRRAPYWGPPIGTSLFLGFRALEHGGTWNARALIEGQHLYKSLGHVEGMTYEEAVKLARAWKKALLAGIDSTKCETVADACREYVQDRRREKGEANAADNEGRYKRTIYGRALGKTKLQHLRAAHIKAWRAKLKMGDASANRYLSALKAALNYAVASRYLDAGKAIEWQSVKPKTVTTRRELYLTPAQRRHLLQHMPANALPFFTGLCLLPLRPGALAGATVADFKPRAKTLFIRHDKANAGRTIPLSSEAVKLFKSEAKDKTPAAPLIAYSDGSAWSRFRWRDPIKEAAAAAGLPSETVAYTLRHCVITDLVVGGLDLLTTAKIAGTSVAMIDKTYGHLRNAHASAALDALAL